MYGFKEFNVEIYSHKVGVCLTDDLKKVNKKLSKKYKYTFKQEDLVSSVIYDWNENNLNEILILLNPFTERISIAVLAHECLHVSTRILEKVGVACIYQDQEAHCYLHDFIVSNTLKNINEMGFLNNIHVY